MAAPDWLIDGTFCAVLLAALRTLRQWWRSRPVQPSPIPREHGTNGGVLDAATRGFELQMGGWEKMYHEAQQRASRAEEENRLLRDTIGELRGDVRVMKLQITQLQEELADLRPQICNQHDCQERLVKPPE